MQVADKMKEAFMASGCPAEICRVEAANDSENRPGAIQLTSRPELGPYDVLIFGAPVRGGRLSPVMDAYLTSQSARLSSPDGKTVLGFVTHFFPKDSLGGTQAVKRMEELLNNMGVSASRTGIIGWMNPFKRNKSIQKTVDDFTSFIREAR